MDEPARRLRIKRAAIALLLATVVAGAIIVDNVGAAVFFYVDSVRLQAAADQAAEAGANYLPGNPGEALRIARRYAHMNGVQWSEIVAATISPNQRQITIEVERPLPFYLTGVMVGLGRRQVVATSTAGVAPPVHAVAHPAFSI